jgi:hypothetical protein
MALSERRVRPTHLGKGADHGKMVRRTHPTLAIASYILYTVTMCALTKKVYDGAQYINKYHEKSL